MLRIASLFLCLFATAGVQSAYVQDTDLISLHYDHAPDKDDGHAAVAALMMSRHLGIQPHVVSGAYGDGNRGSYVAAAEAVMEATWPGAWLNAHRNWNQAVSLTTSKWIETLSAGGDIYVAEGGQSDFTADVVRRIKQTTTFDSNQRVTVVQHSTWNERQASAADLRYVMANTNYIKIDDGNNVNRTADLNQKSAAFVTHARRSAYATQWNAAFRYLNPNTKLDFSDTVEYLHIVGIGKDEIATVNEFAERFFNANNTIIATPSTATPWSDSYSAEGQCYCDTNYDHGLAGIEVETPDGSKTVPEICDAITAKFGTGPGSNRIYYNTVQCGHGPLNNAPDESRCPGIPRANGDYTGYRCNEKGATWNLSTLYSTPPTSPASVPQPPAETPAVLQVSEATTEPPTDNAVTPSTPPVFPVCSDNITDNDNDGYGWENNQSCIVRNSDGTVNSPESPVFATCSDGIIDTDNDGYSWENNRTCIIADSTLIPTSGSTPPTPLDLFPACSDAVSDTHNTGYGWENYKSCVFLSSPVHANLTPSTTATPAELFPACSDAITDTENTGYGWENNRSCIIASSPNHANATPAPPTPLDLFPACSDTINDSHNTGYGWENNRTCIFDTSEVHSNPTTRPPTPLDLFPACSNPLSDSGNTGYGWENNQTCVVTSAFAKIQTVSPVANPVFPICSDSIIDRDNDGYGWEKNRSCIMSDDTRVTPGTIEVVSDATTVASDVAEVSADATEVSADTTEAEPESPQANPVTAPPSTSGNQPTPTISPNALVDINRSNISILFIGNSYLTHGPYLNGRQSRYSVTQQLIDMIGVDISNVNHRVHSIGGGSLKEHWDEGEGEGTPRYDLKNGQYDLVILQGRFDILDRTDYRNRFDTYAGLFADSAARSGTRVLFYGLWATDSQISSTGGDSFGPAANAIYCEAASRHQASCAPNGIAYGLAYKALSSTMNDKAIEDTLTFDHVHPYTPLAYMAANVVYSTIFAKAPLTTSIYLPPGTSRDLGQLMRNAAWNAVTSSQN